MSSQYIFTMYRLSRVHPPDKGVLKDISVSMIPGAKIGVIGPNGPGKSTLLRIMAGRDTEFRGEAQLAPGATVGLLEQEPELDESKDVRGNVEEGLRELRGLLDRFNELSANYSEETADEFARVQERIDAADAWSLDTKLDIAMDALRLPPGDADVARLSGGERRRVALCRLLLPRPTCCSSTSRRTTSTPRRWSGSSATSRSTRGPSWWSPTTATSSTTSPAGSSSSTAATGTLGGNYSAWLEQKQERLATEEKAEKARQRAIARELEWVREAPSARRTKARARLEALEAPVAEEQDDKLDEVQIHIPAGPRLGDWSSSRRPAKGFGDRVLFEDLSFICRAAGSSASSARTGPARRRCSG